MKKVSDQMEQKVVKIFTDISSDRVDAIVFKEVDSLGLTRGYLLQYTISGEKVNGADLNSLIQHYHNS